MSTHHKTTQGRRGLLAAALVSGSLAAAVSTPSFAQPVLSTPRPTLGTVGTITRMTTISGHVPSLVKSSTVLGALAPDQAIFLSVTLPLRNQAALASLLKGLNDPSDARYGQYLTPAQFGAQFGRTQGEYNALIAYLQSKGLTVTQTFPSRTYLSLSGTTAQVNAAFGIALKQFQAPDGRIFHAPDTNLKVPSSIAGYIAAVTGLNNANPPKPLLHVLRRAGASQVKVLVPNVNDVGALVQNPGEQGTGPGGGFAPKDFRTAYGLDGTALNGAGQTIAIIEYGTNFNVKDTLKYEHQFSLPRAPLTVIPVDGGETAYAQDGAAETDLDIACQLSMAPAASIQVYLQSNGNNSVTDAMQAVLANGQAKQLSISYGFGPEDQTETTPDANEMALDQTYMQLAAGGISVYVSSGDSGSQADGSGVTSVDISSSAPDVCAVGGTALTVQAPGSNETYKAESTWNYNNTPSGGAGGGGVSKQWPLPAYQANAATFSAAVTGSNVSTTMRNLPDISCDASPQTGIAVYISGDPGLPGNGWYVFGGTSESAPLWAGYTALVNQNRALGGLPVLGFPNNSLYPLAYTANGLTGSYAGLFHDIKDGSSNLTVAAGTNYAAVMGFDDSTGLGTMQGVNLITALSGGMLYAATPTSGNASLRAQFRRATVRLASFGLPQPYHQSRTAL